MMKPPDPILEGLLQLFPAQDYLQTYEFTAPDRTPEPYHRLLVHEHHMTVTVEEHHHDLVDVLVLERLRGNDSYARKILLALRGSGRIVQFGLVRIHLHFCAPKVREEILSETIPLGRVLINHNVMRRIELVRILKVTPGPKMMEWFGLSAPRTTYGRTAIIHCDGQPAVELLEIVAPE